MTVQIVATPDLPVVWWVFWLVVMAVAIFAALAWWLSRAALREDDAIASDERDGHPEGTQPGHDGDSSAQ